MEMFHVKQYFPSSLNPPLVRERGAAYREEFD